MKTLRKVAASGGLLVLALMSSTAPALATGDWDIQGHHGDESFWAKASKQTAPETPQPGSGQGSQASDSTDRGNTGSANTQRTASEPGGSGGSSQQPDRAEDSPASVILQSYCFTVEGAGQLDCFEMERSRCTEPGSQLVIRAELDTASQFQRSRFGDPFCSTASVPVIAQPATASAAEGEEAPPPMPVVTLEDFQQLDITPSTIETDSGGFGLRNAHTNFYATAEPQTLSVEMLGQQVAIQAVPVQWTWNYGDGSAARSLSQPGGAQTEFNQELDTTHVYEDTGQYPVSLTTAYRGQYSVNDGPWLPIPGTAQVPSTPVTADIWRSKTKNVAENCAQNPGGWACGDPFVED